MRKLFLLGTMVILYACSQLGGATKWPTDSWGVSPPEEQGVDPRALNTIDRELKRKMYGLVNHIVIIHNGHMVMDESYENDYENINRGRDQSPELYNYYSAKWHPYYLESELHTLQSVTKSLTALVIGIAVQRGDFPALDTPVMVFFDGYEVADKEKKHGITIEDLLTMRSGIYWNEWDYEIEDERNTVTQMEHSDDWIQYVLNLPMSQKPGETFVYNSGGSQLLSAIFKQATGVHVDEYTAEYLFQPLGIDDTYWKKTPKGFADTEGGLYLKAEDLAKIGYLVLQQGKWEGEQIVSEEWIEAMTSAHVDDVDPYDPEFNYGYGYQWWLVNPQGSKDGEKPQVIAGFGYGGQRLFVVPELDLVAVIYGWNIYGPQHSTIDLFLEEILPAAIVD